MVNHLTIMKQSHMQLIWILLLFTDNLVVVTLIRINSTLLNLTVQNVIFISEAIQTSRHYLGVL